MGEGVKLNQKIVMGLKYSKQPKPTKTNKLAYPKQILWDTSPSGFGVRVFPSGKKSFVFQYRNEHGQKRLADVGAFGDITLEQARVKALTWAAMLHEGKDPLEEKNKARNGTLMSDLCIAYMERHAKLRKKSWMEDQRRIKLYILPAFGSKQVQQLRRADIAALHHDIGAVQQKPYMANRVREQLSKMFELAKTWGFVDELFPNPARGLDDFDEFEREDYVKGENMSILAEAIEAEENEIAKCVIWMYLLTGKRKTEILETKWSDIDELGGTLKIAPLGMHRPDARKRPGTTKNEEVEYLPLSQEVWEILERAKAFKIHGNPYIFPSERVVGGHLVNVRKVWLRIKSRAIENGATELEGVTIHSLRRTVAIWQTNLADTDLGLVRKMLNQKSLLATKVYAKFKTSRTQRAFEEHGALVSKLSKSSVEDEQAISVN
jgi:integrase